MEWQVVLALVLVVPIILVPVAFVWYLTVGGAYVAMKEAREKKAAREKAIGTVVETK